MDKSSNLKVYLKNPLINEKTLYLYNNFKVCTFLVDSGATKKQIMYEFERLFGIKPIDVKTCIVKPRLSKRDPSNYRKLVIRRKYKKAYIAIGDSSLDIFENIK